MPGAGAEVGCGLSEHGCWFCKAVFGLYDPFLPQSCGAVSSAMTKAARSEPHVCWRLRL